MMHVCVWLPFPLLTSEVSLQGIGHSLDGDEPSILIRRNLLALIDMN